MYLRQFVAVALLSLAACSHASPLVPPAVQGPVVAQGRKGQLAQTLQDFYNKGAVVKSGPLGTSEFAFGEISIDGRRTVILFLSPEAAAFIGKLMEQHSADQTADVTPGIPPADE